MINHIVIKTILSEAYIAMRIKNVSIIFITANNYIENESLLRFLLRLFIFQKFYAFFHWIFFFLQFLEKLQLNSKIDPLKI